MLLIKNNNQRNHPNLVNPKLCCHNLFVFQNPKNIFKSQKERLKIKAANKNTVENETIK